MDAANREHYELLELTVDGEPQPIRRSARRTGQICTVQLGSKAQTGEPVRIRQTFRTITPKWGHRLYVELPQPGKDVSLTMDYTNANVASMQVSDTVSALRPAIIARSPATVPERTIKMDVPGWLLPKAGFAFTWTLDQELPEVLKRDQDSTSASV